MAAKVLEPTIGDMYDMLWDIWSSYHAKLIRMFGSDLLLKLMEQHTTNMRYFTLMTCL